MSKPKVLITNPETPDIAFEILVDKCELVRTADTSREEILRKVSGVDAIFWASHSTVDKEILDMAGPNLKAVATMSAGVNHIDVALLKSRGIQLANTAGVVNDAVADIALLLALGAGRRLHEGRLKIENNDWQNGPRWLLGQEISGSTVGIVGLGGIGQAIARRIKAFRAEKILYTGHRQKPEGKELGATFVNLDTLVRESDFIILSLPLTSETRNLFNEAIFSKMKKTSVFVNISRGAIVDQDALIKALKEGKIFAAGLDVTTPEPLPTDHELLKLPNVVLLPHVGTATFKTRNEMASLTANNILRALNGEDLLTPV